MGKTVCIIGAGVVGLAVAKEAARLGYETYVLEAGPRIAEGVTSRNSGVIHASIYYEPTSLKAQLCLRGRELLYQWCETASVPHRKIGKLIAALSDDQLGVLESTLKNAHEIGATEVRSISAAEAHRMEPQLKCVAALFSPETGIIDPYELSASFQRAAESDGATIVLNARVHAVDVETGGYRIHTSVGPIETQWVINAAGLYADDIARMAGMEQYRVYPWRGDYFTFRSGQTFHHLVYPCKSPGDPGLGVHLTLDLSGKARLGPDVELVSSKEDFGARESKKEAFLAAARRLFPWAESSMLSYDTCGIRPKLRSPSDKKDPDFVIARDQDRWINLVGIESPGLTSSLAIAQVVGELLNAENRIFKYPL